MVYVSITHDKSSDVPLATFEYTCGEPSSANLDAGVLLGRELSCSRFFRLLVLLKRAGGL